MTPETANCVPPMAESDARALRGTSACWEQAIVESAVDGLRRRASALAKALKSAGRKRDAAELQRRLVLFERADELHRHASDLETIAGLLRALSIFAHEHERDEHERAWLQAGMLEDRPSVVHGPAFRETAALRNRAYRLLAEAVAWQGRAARRAAR
jgi:hypothetical protein